jgi:hypothetical protein
VTIASTGNATSFGNLTSKAYGLGACSSSTRGVIAGGIGPSFGTQTSVIAYITIATTGNATSFGTLVDSRASGMSGTSSATRGVFGAADDSSVIQYITIASVGNATFFGNLTIANSFAGACSVSHGGI